MINRIEELRKFVDGVLLNKTDVQDRRCGYVHLYGVAMACGLIAKKRGADVELAVMAGMLHDLWAYKMKETVSLAEVENHHDENGAIYAREALDVLQLTTAAETEIICSAIQNHSKKDGRFAEMDEVLIDADVLQHYFYNPTFPVKIKEEERLKKLLTEFGLDDAV